MSAIPPPSPPQPSPPPQPSYLSRLGATIQERASSFFHSKVPIDPRFLQCPYTPNVTNALNSLYNTRGTFYTNIVVDEYLKVLSEQHPHRFYYSLAGIGEIIEKTPFQIAVEVQKVVARMPDVTDIAIPYNNEDKSLALINKNHHLVFYIDLGNKRVEFYDPKGIPGKETTVTTDLKKSTMRDQLEAIYVLFFQTRTYQIIENTIPHQQCLHRCALWGLHYIYRRLNGHQPEKICSQIFETNYIEVFKIYFIANAINARALRLVKKSEQEQANQVQSTPSQPSQQSIPFEMEDFLEEGVESLEPPKDKGQ